jgi:hypothetical protein
VRLEGLGQLKNPMTSSGMDPATYFPLLMPFVVEGCNKDNQLFGLFRREQACGPRTGTQLLYTIQHIYHQHSLVKGLDDGV